jgi:S-adenosyl-L-methionine hydrolase (adenosine-forming)
MVEVSMDLSSAPAIALLTDFGTRDGYVGVMKGAIACIYPNVRLIDLSHEIPPQNIAAGRYVLMSAYPYFPAGTIYVAVVDPGVGSQRRAIAIQLADGFLVGPDNGIFSGVLQLRSPLQVVELTNSYYWRTDSPSQTFHGRDIFAPVAAHLAQKVPMMELGTAIAPESLVKLTLAQPVLRTEGWTGMIQYCDRFGNGITNLSGQLIQDTCWHVMVKPNQGTGRAIAGMKNYVDVVPGEAIALVGSSGWIEIAINQGHAQRILGLEIGDSVILGQGEYSYNSHL